MSVLGDDLREPPPVSYYEKVVIEEHDVLIVGVTNVDGSYFLGQRADFDSEGGSISGRVAAAITEAVRTV